jgi:tetratricopeptide (TPR) repeat protein
MTVRTALWRLFRLLAVLALSAQGYAQEPAAGPGSAKPSPPQAKLETLAVVSDRAPVKAGDKVVATVEKGRMFGVIERRGDQVEIQVCVGTQILRGTLQTSHVKLLTDDDVDVAAEWLKMARDLDPKVDIPAYRARLDALVERVAAAAALGKTPREEVRLIGVQLFEREGFSPHEGINTPDRVLDLKQGDCFGFSFLYLCIARRLKMPLYLVLAPGHAFVRYEDRGEHFNIETTREGKLHDTVGYLREHLGAQRFSQVGGADLAILPVPSALSTLFLAWGEALRAMGKAPDACGKFAKAVEINPRLAGAYSNWGVALDAMGKAPEACHKYAKAVQINPRFVDAYSNWGAALGAMGKLADACEKFAKAVEINPRYAEAYNNWGLALAAMDKPAEACEKYAKAVEIKPRLALAYFNWGIALKAISKNAEAIEKLDKAAALDPALKPKVEELRKELLGKK